MSESPTIYVHITEFYVEPLLKDKTVTGEEINKKIPSEMERICGDSRSRTDDPLLAKQVL